MRQSGVLLHITSLPSPGGVGTLGREAYAFCDFMVKAGLKIWQVLPIGPTGFGESPYQSASTYAGNPMLIDLRRLQEEGLLDAPLPHDSGDPCKVDFDRVRREKNAVLRQSFESSFSMVADEVEAFSQANPWLQDYALFMAVKEHFSGQMWQKWPDEGLRFRRPEAIARAKEQFRREIDFHRYLQWIFFRQWSALKRYCNEKGVELFGDMPIYVAEDSADTWTHPKLFQLNPDLTPQRVAGVPPDYFSEDGQRWGNPLYNWKAMRREKFRWWLDRLGQAQEMFNWLRIDHFIGFANFYSIPASCPTAREGKWVKAPGKKLFKRVKREIRDLKIVAEDLGEVGPRVQKLIRYCGYPGMKVLVFGFDSDESNPHFPGNIVENAIVYTGTHDNDTVAGWWEKATPHVQEMAGKYLPPMEDICDAMIECAFRSVAETCIVPMQDYLHLGGEARMNYPGTVGGNWLWRMAPDEDLSALAESIFALNRRTARLSPAADSSAATHKGGTNP